MPFFESLLLQSFRKIHVEFENRVPKFRFYRLENSTRRPLLLKQVCRSRDHSTRHRPLWHFFNDARDLAASTPDQLPLCV